MLLSDEHVGNRSLACESQAARGSVDAHGMTDTEIAYAAACKSAPSSRVSSSIMVTSLALRSFKSALVRAQYPQVVFESTSTFEDAINPLRVSMAVILRGSLSLSTLIINIVWVHLCFTNNNDIGKFFARLGVNLLSNRNYAFLYISYNFFPTKTRRTNTHKERKPNSHRPIEVWLLGKDRQSFYARLSQNE